MCKWWSRRVKEQCQLEENHDGMHRFERYGKISLWSKEGAYIPNRDVINVIIPDNFRAVKRSKG